jgi:AcrR family transcriptional regulator
MQALPGRAARLTPDAPPASVTRAGAHADQRRRILRAIAELVAENGYADVTVELIVKRARCSYKTFYKHFAGKEECFIALFDTAVATSEDRVRRRLVAEPLTWSDQVVATLRTLVDLILAEPAVARAVIVESPTVGPEIAERYERATKALVPLLRAGREISPRGAELPETIEETLAGAVFWAAYERLVVDDAPALAEYLPVLTELILRTYLGPAEGARIARAETEQREPALA